LLSAVARLPGAALRQIAPVDPGGGRAAVDLHGGGLRRPGRHRQVQGELGGAVRADLDGDLAVPGVGGPLGAYQHGVEQGGLQRVAIAAVAVQLQHPPRP
jgi:hypothetical protein